MVELARIQGQVAILREIAGPEFIPVLKKFALEWAKDTK